jgi:hypothetical protein
MSEIGFTKLHDEAQLVIALPMMMEIVVGDLNKS